MPVVLGYVNNTDIPGPHDAINFVHTIALVASTNALRGGFTMLSTLLDWLKGMGHGAFSTFKMRDESHDPMYQYLIISYVRRDEAFSREENKRKNMLIQAHQDPSVSDVIS